MGCVPEKEAHFHASTAALSPGICAETFPLCIPSGALHGFCDAPHLGTDFPLSRLLYAPEGVHRKRAVSDHVLPVLFSCLHTPCVRTHSIATRSIRCILDGCRISSLRRQTMIGPANLSPQMKRDAVLQLLDLLPEQFTVHRDFADLGQQSFLFSIRCFVGFFGF
jgi:hypothetical protein